MLTAGAADAATLRPDVVVHEDTVRLRDIFDGAGDRGDTVLFRAPAPGQSVVLPAKWLHHVARSYELDWQPVPGLDESRVKRSSNRITAALIAGAVAKALDRRIAPEKRYEVSLDNPGLEIHVPVQFPATVTIRNLRYDERTNRYSAIAVAPDDRPGSVATPIAGRVHELIAVPVLSRRLHRGDVIREQDVDAKLLHADQVGQNAITTVDQVVGKSARRTLMSGRLLNGADIREPQMVTRGSMVIMSYRAANLTITAHGTAREHGMKGDTIRVRNANSGKTVEAVVTGPDSVSVLPLTVPAAR